MGVPESECVISFGTEVRAVPVAGQGRAEASPLLKNSRFHPPNLSAACSSHSDPAPAAMSAPAHEKHQIPS